jgi:hypothetical protein
MIKMQIQSPNNPELTASIDDGPVGVNVTYFRKGEAIYSNIYEYPFHCVLNEVYRVMERDLNPLLTFEAA